MLQGQQGLEAGMMPRGNRMAEARPAVREELAEERFSFVPIMKRLEMVVDDAQALAHRAELLRHHLVGGSNPKAVKAAPPEHRPDAGTDMSMAEHLGRNLEDVTRWIDRTRREIEAVHDSLRAVE